MEVGRTQNSRSCVRLLSDREDDLNVEQNERRKSRKDGQLRAYWGVNFISEKDAEESQSSNSSYQ